MRFNGYLCHMTACLFTIVSASYAQTTWTHFKAWEQMYANRNILVKYSFIFISHVNSLAGILAFFFKKKGNTRILCTVCNICTLLEYIEYYSVVTLTHMAFFNLETISCIIVH